MFENNLKNVSLPSLKSALELVKIGIEESAINQEMGNEGKILFRKEKKKREEGGHVTFQNGKNLGYMVTLRMYKYFLIAMISERKGDASISLHMYNGSHKLHSRNITAV
jgi:hypothetical protein